MYFISQTPPFYRWDICKTCLLRSFCSFFRIFVASANTEMFSRFVSIDTCIATWMQNDAVSNVLHRSRLMKINSLTRLYRPLSLTKPEDIITRSLVMATRVLANLTYRLWNRKNAWLDLRRCRLSWHTWFSTRRTTESYYLKTSVIFILCVMNMLRKF